MAGGPRPRLAAPAGPDERFRALAAVLPAWRDLAESLPETATTSVGIQRLPPLDDPANMFRLNHNIA